MPLVTRKRVLAAKAESSYGTWTAPSGTDADIRYYRSGDGPILTPSRTYTGLERQGGTGTEGGIPEQGQVAVSGFTHFRGKGSSGMPAIGKLLRASGFKLNTDTYVTSSVPTDWVSLSMAEYVDGRWTPAKGILLDGTFNFTAGKAAVFNFTGMGGLKGPASAWSDAAIVTGSYESVTAPLWQPTTDTTDCLKLGTNSLTGSTCAIALNNNVSMREGESSPAYAGYLGAWIEPTDPTVTLDPEAVLRAGLNPDQLFEDQTALDLVLTIDGGAYNYFKFTAAACVFTQYPGEGNRGGRLTHNYTLACTGGLSVLCVKPGP